MPNQDSPVYGLSELYLFPYYQTREDYKKAIGEDAPNFDPSRAPKGWFDPSAAASPRRNIVYEQVIATTATGNPIIGSSGAPEIDVLVLSKDEAATVNIPVRAANVPGANVPEVQPPLRPLHDDEEFTVLFGGVVAVKKKGYQDPNRGFTDQDRMLLTAIAKKLGV